MMLAIQKAFQFLGDENGRGGMSKIAKHFGITDWAVSKWQDIGVPAERCPDIELLTNGQVRCEELRPDVNWSILRNKKATNAN